MNMLVRHCCVQNVTPSMSLSYLSKCTYHSKRAYHKKCNSKMHILYQMLICMLGLIAIRMSAEIQKMEGPLIELRCSPVPGHIYGCIHRLPYSIQPSGVVLYSETWFLTIEPCHTVTLHTNALCHCHSCHTQMSRLSQFAFTVIHTLTSIGETLQIM